MIFNRLDLTSRISHLFFSIAYPMALSEPRFIFSDPTNGVESRHDDLKLGLQFGTPTLIFLDMYGINLITTGNQKKEHT